MKLHVLINLIIFWRLILVKTHGGRNGGGGGDDDDHHQQQQQQHCYHHCYCHYHNRVTSSSMDGEDRGVGGSSDDIDNRIVPCQSCM